MQVLDHNDCNNILVDKEGYEQFIEELEKLKNKSLSVASSGSESYKDAVGDGWHDNFDFENSMRESRTIAKMIDKMMLEAQKLKIVERKRLDKDIINLDDIVKVEIIYSENDLDTEMVKLTGKYIPTKDNEITLNSPLGSAIYKKKIGTVTNYKVNDKMIMVKIIEKVS